MSYCNKCGTQLSDGTNFCPKCGTPCDSSFSQSAGESGVVEQKKSSKVPIKALLSVILIIALIGGGWLVWKNLGNDYSLDGLAKAVVNYDAVGSFHCGRAHVIKYTDTPDGGMVYKYGYIDKMGNEVIPCKYEGDEMMDYEFHEGLTAVSNGQKYAYIDVDGKEITSFIYDEAGSFSEGYAVVTKNEKNYIIDTSGKELIELKYSPCIDERFSEGLFPVWGDEGIGFINTKGELVIPCKYNSTEFGMCFSEGLAAVYDGNKFGYIDKTGKEVIPFVYDNAYPFSEGLAAVNKEEKWFYIDKSGKSVLETNTDCLGFEDGLAVERSEDEHTYFYVYKTGKKAFDGKYDSAYPFENGYARVGKKSGDGYLYGMIDKTGKEVIPCKYKNLYSLSEGLALIQVEDTYGFVDLHGKSTFDVENEEVKQLVQQKIKEKEEKKKAEEKKKREEEEKRRKYEEEHGATGTFYSLAQNSKVWKYVNKTRFNDYYITLYFYPINRTRGNVSIVQYANNGRGGFMIFKQSKHCTYEISNDAITIGNSFGVAPYDDYDTRTLELTIVKNNDFSVELHDTDSEWAWTFYMISPEFNDPIK